MRVRKRTRQRKREREEERERENERGEKWGKSEVERCTRSGVKCQHLAPLIAFRLILFVLL